MELGRGKMIVHEKEEMKERMREERGMTPTWDLSPARVYSTSPAN